MKSKCLTLAVCAAVLSASGVLAEGEGAAPAAGAGAAAKAAFDQGATRYIETTQEDLKSDSRFPHAAVTLLTSEFRKTDSLSTPFAGSVDYLVEYDAPAGGGARDTHSYRLKCSWFDGKWDIDPHGHRDRKNVTDLEKKATEILFPNI